MDLVGYERSGKGEDTDENGDWGEQDADMHHVAPSWLGSYAVAFVIVEIVAFLVKSNSKGMSH